MHAGNVRTISGFFMASHCSDDEKLLLCYNDFLVFYFVTQSTGSL
jgi:hypothetical protein